jgi:hypothetical protein
VGNRVKLGQPEETFVVIADITLLSQYYFRSAV